MNGVNIAVIMGTVGSDPEVKKVGEQTLTKFSLATNRTYTNKKTGEKETQTQWHRIEAWGALGDTLAQYVRKGKHIFIEGEIRYNTYEKDGVKKSVTSILAKGFTFAGGNSPSNGEDRASVPESVATEKVKQYATASAPPASSEPTQTASSADVMDNFEGEDDLPF